jgi:hypothetical protein
MTVKALTDTLISDACLSVQKGCEMKTVVTRPDLLVQKLIDQGLLPPWAECSNEAFVIHDKQTRTALWGITVEELVQRRQDINDYVDQYTVWSGGTIYRLLWEMLLHGFRAGCGAVKDDPVSELLVKICQDPDMSRLIVSGGVNNAGELAMRLLEMGGKS